MRYAFLPAHPVMRWLGWGVFLLLWPLSLGDGQWLTLATGLAGGFLLLLALWRLRDASGYFRRAFFWLFPVLLLQAGGLAASYYLAADARIWLLAASCLCIAALLVQITRGLSGWLPPGSSLRPRTAAAWYLLGTLVLLYLFAAHRGRRHPVPVPLPAACALPDRRDEVRSGGRAGPRIAPFPGRNAGAAGRRALLFWRYSSAWRALP